MVDEDSSRMPAGDGHGPWDGAWGRTRRALAPALPRLFCDVARVDDDGRLHLRPTLAPALRPACTAEPDGLHVRVMPWATTGGRTELRRWGAGWSLVAQPRPVSRAKLVLLADDGYRGPLGGRWTLGYADALADLVARIGSDPAAQEGLGDRARVERVVAVLNSQTLDWPLGNKVRGAVVDEAVKVLRGPAAGGPPR